MYGSQFKFDIETKNKELRETIDKVNVDTHIVKTGWNPGLSAKESVALLIERNSLQNSEIHVSATGYGREAIAFADYIFTEITCHAYE